MTYDNYGNSNIHGLYGCEHSFGGAAESLPHIVSGGTQRIIYVTNNRAKYFSELAKKYKDDAKEFRDSAKYYAEQNADVTMAYVTALESRLQRSIDTKQAAGNYALASEIPTKVSDLTNDSQYATSTDVSTAVSPVSMAVNDLSTATGTALNGKAGIDFQNISDNAKSLAATFAMPSATYIDLTLGASGTLYTAPANGWVELSLELPAYSYLNISMQNFGNVAQFTTGQFIQTWATIVPVVKNATFSIGYDNFPNTSVAWTRFRFIYAQGSESEAN